MNISSLTKMFRTTHLMVAVVKLSQSFSAVAPHNAQIKGKKWIIQGGSYNYDLLLINHDFICLLFLFLLVPPVLSLVVVVL